MLMTLVTPPVLVGRKPAERTAGCTHVVYLAPNIYHLTVAALLERDGHQIAQRDFVYDRQKRRDFENWLANDNSDAYLIWAVNLSIDNDREACRIILDRRPDCHIILLGPGPTYFTERFLFDPRIIVVRGEPEQTVSQLAHALADDTDWHRLQGISWLDARQVVNNPARPLMTDIDALPFPARHLIANQRYFNPKLNCDRYTTAFTSRNCPHRCTYCVPSSLSFAREIEHRRLCGKKPPIAMRSVESVDREMDEIAQMGYNGVGFMDDNFIWNEKRTTDLCDVMRRHRLVWGCQARADAITQPIAKALAESGCRYVDLGVESFDDRILADIGKDLNSSQINNAIELLHSHKVPVKLNILIGCSPLETPQTVSDTLRQAKRMKVDQVMFNIVSPFPGTEYYDTCRKNGWIDGGEYVPTDVQRNSIINLPHLSARQMERALRRNNLSFFLSWHFVSTHINRFSNPRQWLHAAKALNVKLFG